MSDSSDDECMPDLSIEIFPRCKTKRDEATSSDEGAGESDSDAEERMPPVLSPSIPLPDSSTPELDVIEDNTAGTSTENPSQGVKRTFTSRKSFDPSTFRSYLNPNQSKDFRCYTDTGKIPSHIVLTADSQQQLEDDAKSEHASTTQATEPHVESSKPQEALSVPQELLAEPQKVLSQPKHVVTEPEEMASSPEGEVTEGQGVLTVPVSAGEIQLQPDVVESSLRSRFGRRLRSPTTGSKTKRAKMSNGVKANDYKKY